MFRYEIGGKTYVQKALVLGQIQQLKEILGAGEIKIPASFRPRDVFEILGPSFYKVLAVLLTEEGKSPKDKDINAASEELAFNVELETAFEVIDDFFDCNPISSVSEKLMGIGEKMIRKLTGSSRPRSSSPEEISPKETKSSGDMPSQNANPI